MEFFVLLYKTVLLRPYVFVFLVAFLVSSIVTMGLKRTAVFWFGTWAIAFLSEFSSTRNGFPYGFYHYMGTTRGQELFIFNIPFMDSLSYSFLLFASYSTALLSLSPLYVRKGDVQTVDRFDIRQGGPVLVLTTVFMMMIDVVIDPVALRGDRWFLGQIYYYDYAGYYFGVPLSNALGWALVGFIATALYQFLERRFLGPELKDSGIRLWRNRSLMGVGLYFGVLVFNLAITAWIREFGLLIAGCFIYLVPTLLLGFRLMDAKVRATDEEWREYCKEFHLPVRI